MYRQLQQLHYCNMYLTTVMTQHHIEVSLAVVDHPPPDYQAAQRMEEEALPSYWQAVHRQDRLPDIV